MRTALLMNAPAVFTRDVDFPLPDGSTIEVREMPADVRAHQMVDAVRMGFTLAHETGARAMQCAGEPDGVATLDDGRTAEVINGHAIVEHDDIQPFFRGRGWQLILGQGTPH